MVDKIARLGQNLSELLVVWGWGYGAEVQPWPWEVGEGSTTTLQAQRQGLAQAMTEGRTPSSIPRPVLFTSVPFLANLSHSKSCFEKMKKCYLNVDCGGTLASTSAIALTASPDLSDVAGVRCLHPFTTLVVPHEENKTTFQTAEGCPLAKILSM